MLHCLHELLLVVLALFGCLDLRELLLLAGVSSCGRVVEVLGARLSHRSALVVGQRLWPLRRESNFVLLFHLVYLDLLLLHDLGKL